MVIGGARTSHGGASIADAAGARSGIDSMYMEGKKKIRGLAGQSLRQGTRASSTEPTLRHPLGRSLQDFSRTVWTGVEDCEAVPASSYENRMTGNIPKIGVPKPIGNIPGYTGFIPRKVAENVHGDVSGVENERAITMPHYYNEIHGSLHANRSQSLPQLPPEPITWRSGEHTGEGLNIVPRVPGYMGYIPGKASETVHGYRFGEVNEIAQKLRRKNQFVTSEGWMKRSPWPADKLPTYHFQAKMLMSNTDPLFSKVQDVYSLEANQRLGHTFGLRPLKKSRMKPGDRYLHHVTESFGQRLEPAVCKEGGQPSQSQKFDQQRWRDHNALTVSNGNQRVAY